MTTKEALRRSGNNLTLIRHEKDFSIASLAVLSGVDAEVITAMESGNFDFNVSMVYELAAALNVDFRQILVDPTGQA